MMQMATSPTSVVKLNRDGTPSRLLKRSKIWEVYWIVPDDPSKALCKECQGVISRGGGTGKSQCTTNLWKHLENRHPELFKTMGKFKEVVHRSHDNARSPKIMDSIGKPDETKVWEIFCLDENDPTSAKCNECGIEIRRLPDDPSTDLFWCHIMADHPEIYTKYASEAFQFVTSAPGSKRSDVWNEFTQHPLDCCKVVCNTCDAIVSRGTSKERLNTTNMRRHLTGNVHLNAIRLKGMLHSTGDLGPNSEKDINFASTNGSAGNGANDQNSFSSRHIPNGTDPFNFLGFARKSQSDELSSIIMDRQVDLVHTGLLGRALYEQQKQGLYCDFSIILRYKSTSPSSVGRGQTTGMGNGDEHLGDVVNECADEFRIHRSVAIAMSGKLRSTIESGSDKINLIDVNKDSIPSFIEIMYTGRLANASYMKKAQLQEILNLAELLSASSVVEYMKRSHPKLSARPNASQKMIPSQRDETTPATRNLTSPAPNLTATSQDDEPNLATNSQEYEHTQLEPPARVTTPSSTDVKSQPMSNIPEDGGNEQTPIAPDAGFADSNTSVYSSISEGSGSGPGTPTSTPKVNKRKNYMPVSNSSSSVWKKRKLDDKIEACLDLSKASQSLSSDSSSDIDVV